MDAAARRSEGKWFRSFQRQLGYRGVPEDEVYYLSGVNNFTTTKRNDLVTSNANKVCLSHYPFSSDILPFPTSRPDFLNPDPFAPSNQRARCRPRLFAGLMQDAHAASDRSVPQPTVPACHDGNCENVHAMLYGIFMIGSFDRMTLGLPAAKSPKLPIVTDRHLHEVIDTKTLEPRDL